MKKVLLPRGRVSQYADTFRVFHKFFFFIFHLKISRQSFIVYGDKIYYDISACIFIKPGFTVA